MIVAKSYGRLKCGNFRLPERTLRRYLDMSKDKGQQDSGFYIPMNPGEIFSKEMERYISNRDMCNH
ncbi:MAG TPA: hypothetical protein DCE52_15120 [Rhodobacteraceae bacterium]|nr:hypothetical protein [Paracoccaceae bacterium]